MCFHAKLVHAPCNIPLAFILMQLLLFFVLINSAAGSLTKGLTRTRSAKIANIHGLQAAAESLPEHAVRVKDAAGNKTSTHSSATNRIAGRYQIHGVAGEPNYKSVNLTWEVEFVGFAADAGDDGGKSSGFRSRGGVGVASNSVYAPKTTDTTVTNGSAEVEPPKAFQIFYCELQSFGPHRCRSKLLDGQLQQVENTYRDQRQLRQYAAQIDNLRMATRYSFHIRPQQQHKSSKITGRSEVFNNEIEEGSSNLNNGGQTIIIPTKGFSAQATKCLPHASEIEVETGPYFGGKIVVDGGNCGIKGNPNDPLDKYTMRIDHKLCGSLVKPETNTVETFITVQENLGIFTHSTRRFVVVCSFQSGMQTVRASFTVPRKEGIASAVENDPFEPDERLGREYRQMRYVDRSGLVLKETSGELMDRSSTGGEGEAKMSEEAETAIVHEVSNPMKADQHQMGINTKKEEDKERVEGREEGEEEEKGGMEGFEKNDADSQNAEAIVEYIVPGINEGFIKHHHQQHQEQQEQQQNKLSENDDTDQQEREIKNNNDRKKEQPDQIRDYEERLNEEEQKAKFEIENPSGGHARLTKYDQLMADQQEPSQGPNDWYDLVFRGKVADESTLQQVATNLGSIVLAISLSVIMIGVFVYVALRETHRQTLFNSSNNMHRSKRCKSPQRSTKQSKTLTPSITQKQQQQQQHKHQPKNQQHQCNL